MNIHFFKGVVCLFSLCLLLTNCNEGAKQSTENKIQFDSIRVEKVYHLMETKENPNCNLQINFIYPSQYDNKDILKKIQNQFVCDYFGEQYESMSPQEAINQYTNDYLNSYKELEKDFKSEIEKDPKAPVSAWFSYYEMLTGNLIYNSNNIISYTIGFENYTGGAHGSHAYNNHVIDLLTGSIVTEEEIFIDNYQDELAAILIDAIAKEQGVDKPKDLENIGFFSVEEIFPNNNFLVNEEGLTYTFNEYEIAAYVVGAINIFLPYENIEFLLKRESPISAIVWK